LQTPGEQHERPQLLTDVINAQGRLTWHKQAINWGQPVGTLATNGVSPLFEENLSPNKSGQESYNLIRIDDLDTGTPWLADTVDDSFLAWRNRLQNEVSYDFLGTLSDATRDVGAYSETSQYASWHKSGRAIDTLFDYHVDGQLAHEIVKENYSGETYWRTYLRCVDQSGGCGRPITVSPWNYSSRARTEIAPEQGGILKSAPPAGYYVDMTALAREYGWERISSYDDEEYSWTWYFLAFEYWHYQKKLANGHKVSANSSASNWYQAMLDIYPSETLERFFTWQKMRSLDDDPHLIALKGVPLPLEAKPWWNLVEH
jgi:TolB protein